MNDYFAHLQNYGADEVKLANYIALLPSLSSNNYPLDVIFSPKQLRQVNTFLYEEFKQFGYEMLSC